MKWICEKRNVSSLKEWPKNPRKMTESGIKSLTESIRKFGIAEPLVINTDNVICGGHGRKKVLIQEDIKEVDCYIPEVTLTDKEFEELNIRLNKNIAGIFDYDILANEFELEELIEYGFTLEELQIDIEPIEGKIDDDEVPEVKESRVKRGDIWQLGNHRVMCGDSTMIDDVEKLMCGQKNSVLFTSPPYSDMRDYNGKKDLSIDNLINFIPAYLEFANYQVINIGIQRKNHEIVEYWQDYIAKAKECGYKFLSWNVWDKGEAGSIGNQTAMFPLEHEWIFVFGKMSLKINKTIDCKWANQKSTANSRRNRDGSLTKVDDILVGDKKAMGTVYRKNALKARNLDNSHPAAFTVDFAEGYVVSMTESGGVLVDPFLGSGSTLIACEKTGRKCHGMELDEHYCDVVISRYEKFTGKEAVLINGTTNT